MLLIYEHFEDHMSRFSHVEKGHEIWQPSQLAMSIGEKYVLNILAAGSDGRFYIAITGSADDDQNLRQG